MERHLQAFESNSEIYHLSSGFEMIGFPQKTDSSLDMLKGLAGNHHFHGGAGASSSKAPIGIPNTSQYYHQGHDHMIVSPDWNQNRLLVDHHVFPRVSRNKTSSRGISLSLDSSNSIGFQLFEVRQQESLRFGPSSSKDGYSESYAAFQDQGHFETKNSNYLNPAQELLKEFCNLGSEKNDRDDNAKLKINNQKGTSDQLQDENALNEQSLCSLDLLELQRRKTKLIQMLEEVDRRYKNYCLQLKGTVSSFEAVAGNGEAITYSASASKAVSMHFRCLRDAIVGQIKATKKAVEKKNNADAPGTSRGETPRLRILDQTLRQHKAVQHMNMMESQPWRTQRGLPERSVSILRAWLFEHFFHPYPSDVHKHILAHQTGLSRSQVSNWFINARVRLWKPMVEEMYLKELKEQESMEFSLDETGDQPNQNQPPQAPVGESDWKTRNDKPPSPTEHQHGFGRVDPAYGSAVQLNFSAYNQNSVSYEDISNTGHEGGRRIGGGGNSGGVSLTLGLHQYHGANDGVNSFLYTRDNTADCSQVEFSLLDSENQRLLHDLTWVMSKSKE